MPPQAPVHLSALTLNTVHQFTSTKLHIRQPERWKRCRNETPNQYIPTIPQSRLRQQVGSLLLLFCPPAFAELELWFPFHPTPARPGDATVAEPLRLLHTWARAAGRVQSQEPPGHGQTTMCILPWDSAGSSVASVPCGCLFTAPPLRPSPWSQACTHCGRVAKARCSCPQEGEARSRDPQDCTGHGHVCWARASTAGVCLAQTLPPPSLVCQKDRGAGARNISSCQGMSHPPPVSRRHKETSSSLRQTGFVLSSCKHRCFYLKQKTQDVTDEWRNADRPAACRAPQTGECFSGSRRVSRQD